MRLGDGQGRSGFPKSEGLPGGGWGGFKRQHDMTLPAQTCRMGCKGARVEAGGPVR